MDLGIAGKRALVCAASKGLGFACASALAAEGVAVAITGRDEARLNAAAAAIRSAHSGAQVTIAVGDISTIEGRAAALQACPEPDILVTNNGGPPPGDWRDLRPEDWHRAIDANMISPIELIRAVTPAMADRGWGRVVNITSHAVKAAIDVLGLSNGARSGLTGFVAGIARPLAAQGVIVNNLCPGPFETDRMRGALGRVGFPPVGRFGQPAEFGSMCAFLSSEHVGYLVGQNILVDGGGFPGVF